MVLILLGIAIALLDRLETLLTSKEDQESEAVPESQPAPAPPAVAESGVSHEVVAAIGAAIALAQQESSSAVVAAAQSDTTGSWLQSGRFREMSARSAGPGRKS